MCFCLYLCLVSLPGDMEGNKHVDVALESSTKVLAVTLEWHICRCTHVAHVMLSIDRAGGRV
jgi:hypothetical protein